ncbi:Hypothetical protein CINCED_3A000347 [Cinara cedri]|nr:Hypothetical protein CINCED_3A000347 [Cinara cedri]
MSISNKKKCFLCSKIISKSSSTALHDFPLDIETRSLWLKACAISDKEYSPSVLICSKHFEKDSFQSFSMRILKSNAIPTKFTKIAKNICQLQTNDEKCIANIQCEKGNCNQSHYTSINNEAVNGNIKQFIESSRVPVIFKNMLDNWEPFKWDLEKWNSIFENQLLDCRKGKITCTKEPLWENKCSNESHLFSEILKMSKNIENNGDWLYFDYKYIGENVDEKIFQSITWEKLGYENLGAKDSTLWIGSTGAHTPCHQDLYGVNLVAQVCGIKRWILMPPEMGKYLKPSRVPYEESSCYSRINFSCPDNLIDIDEACKCVSIILSPGDVLFVPHKWWHYVENLTTAISINTWIQTPKYDNVARLSESVVRLMVSSICSGVSEKTQLQLLNPNETFSTSMAAESIKFIDQSIKMIETEKETTDSMKLSSTSLLKCQFKMCQPEQSLCKVQFDTKHHRNNHTSSLLESNDTNIEDSHKLLLDALCNENVINQIVCNLINKDQPVP